MTEGDAERRGNHELHEKHERRRVAHGTHGRHEKGGGDHETDGPTEDAGTMFWDVAGRDQTRWFVALDLTMPRIWRARSR